MRALRRRRRRRRRQEKIIEAVSEEGGSGGGWRGKDISREIENKEERQSSEHKTIRSVRFSENSPD